MKFKHMLIAFTVSAAALLMTLVACDPVKKTAGFQDPSNHPASIEETATFDTSLMGIGRIESVAAAIQSPANVTINDDITNQIKQALINAHCQVSYAKDTSAASNRQSSLSIAGTGCPILANYKVSYQNTGSAGNADVTASFSVTDPALQQSNDITSLDLSGKGNYSIHDSQGNLSLALHGTANSKSHGKIELLMTNQQTSAVTNGGILITGQQSIRAVSSKMDVQIRANIYVAAGVDQSKYFINNAEISSDKYKTYLRWIGMILN